MPMEIIMEIIIIEWVLLEISAQVGSSTGRTQMGWSLF